MRHRDGAAHVQVLLRIRRCRRACRCPRSHRVPTTPACSCRASADRPTCTTNPVRRDGSACRCRSPSSPGSPRAPPSSAHHPDTSRTRRCPLSSRHDDGSAAWRGHGGAGAAGGLHRGLRTWAWAGAWPRAVGTEAAHDEGDRRERQDGDPRMVITCKRRVGSCRGRLSGRTRGRPRRTGTDDPAARSAPHRGYTGRQTFCPQVTRYRLM